MKRGLIITLPTSDLVTQYLTIFSKEILSFSDNRNINIRKLKDSEANKEEFEKALKKLDYHLIVFNGHGNVDCITGHKEKPIIQLGHNHSLLKNRITYARSCFAAQGVGVESMRDSKDGCFIGYSIPFMFLSDVYHSGNPSKDSIAKTFLETSNLIPISLMKGHSAKEADENCKKSMLKVINRAILKADDDSQSIAQTMWNNYCGQVVLGNEEAKLID